MRRPRADVDMADIQGLQMPMKVRLEFGAIVGLHDLHPEWQPSKHFVDESNRRPLVAGVVDLEHSDTRAVVDRRELVEPLPCARDPLEKLDVHLQAVTRLWLLVALPSLRV